MNPFERLRSVIPASTLIAYADQNLFENDEAGFMLEGLAINSLAPYDTSAKFTAISELLLHGCGSVTLYSAMVASIDGLYLRKKVGSVAYSVRFDDSRWAI